MVYASHALNDVDCALQTGHLSCGGRSPTTRHLFESFRERPSASRREHIGDELFREVPRFVGVLAPRHPTHRRPVVGAILTVEAHDLIARAADGATLNEQRGLR